MDTPWAYVLWGCASYLLGSVSFGDIVTRVARFPIRELGTGNPGTANIFREVGARYSAVVLALDLAKGMVATLPALLLDLPVWVGLAGTTGVLVGHFLPVFWGFRGGTGMVVAMGTTLGLVPLGGLIATPLALVALRLSKNAGYSGAVFFHHSRTCGLAGAWRSRACCNRPGRSCGGACQELGAVSLAGWSRRVQGREPTGDLWGVAGRPERCYR